jgi:hypothetical protein
MAAARRAFSRRPARVAARLTLILLLAAGLAALTLVAAPARAGDGASGAPTSALLGAAPAPAPSFAPALVPPIGEEARGTDYGKDWQHCVQVVANLRAAPPTTPLVVLLGGSSARESTVLDDHWERQITRRSGYVVDAYNLGSKHRSYAQDLAFVKLLPAGVPTIVYVGVNLGRFCLPVRPVSITLPSPRTLPPWGQHVYSRDRIQTRAQKRYYVSYWLARRYPEFRANYKSELVMLERIIRACKRRGLRVALVDLPRDLPVIGSAFDVPVSRYHAGCARLARAWDIPWLHFNAQARFADRDFFDIFHLVEPGRVKFQSILSDRTIGLLKRYRMPRPEPTPSPSPSPSPSASTSAPASPAPAF